MNQNNRNKDLKLTDWHGTHSETYRMINREKKITTNKILLLLLLLPLLRTIFRARKNITNKKTLKEEKKHGQLTENTTLVCFSLEFQEKKMNRMLYVCLFICFE